MEDQLDPLLMVEGLHEEALVSLWWNNDTTYQKKYGMQKKFPVEFDAVTI